MGRGSAPRGRCAWGALTVAGIVLYLRALPHLRCAARPVYERLGILPEIAHGIGQTSNLTVPPER